MSSDDLAVSIRGLGKSYRITHNNVQHSTLAETLLDRVRHPFRRVERETFWALEDVSLDVRSGEAVGIIGRNGAGKSTLLKILSRITEPSRGKIDLYGRVGSLLEVGTGFHRELTGRENIYLNGSILGMKRREIERHFDAIVDFSGVEKFLDTPVKRYSSGMYVRLAFAVAAHLEPEILIVDEVLAVGDMEFQKKCLGKMGDVAKSGRTVLFVSHNLALVQSLCDRAAVLSAGRCVFDGDVLEGVQFFLSELRGGNATVCLSALEGRGGSGEARLTEIIFENDEGQPTPVVQMGDPLVVVLRFQSQRPLSRVNFGIVVHDQCGQRIFRVQADEVLLESLPSCRSGGEARCRIPELTLVPGYYNVTVGMGLQAGGQLDHISNAAGFQVVEADVFGTGRFPDRATGTVYTRSQWSFACQ